MSIEVNKKAPDFSLPDQDGKTHSLKDYKGKNIILYFYPRDNTPGCTTEANTFNELKADFDAANIEIIGVSKDPQESHKKFCDKFGLTFTLLSDEEGKMIEEYDAWGEKSMYGNKYMGILRNAVLINAKGNVVQYDIKVSPSKYPAQILKQSKELL